MAEVPRTLGLLVGMVAEVSGDWTEGIDLQAEAQGTGDDPVLCHLCGRDFSVATIVEHLTREHEIDPDDIANAPIVDST